MRKFISSILVSSALLIFFSIPAIAAEPAQYYPIYRLYNSRLHDRLYTGSTEEVARAEKIGYVSEGVLGRVSERVLLESQTPLYRLYQPKLNRHQYTDSNDEMERLVLNEGYRLEGHLGFLLNNGMPGDERWAYRIVNPATGEQLVTRSWVEWGMLQLAGWRDGGRMIGQFYAE